jgi:hypothetical protein
LDLF